MRHGWEEPVTVETAAQPLDEPSRPARLGFLRIVDLAADTDVAAALIGELLAVLAHVIARTFFHNSFLWSDEIARFALSLIAFIGGAVAYRRRDHAFVRVLLDLAPRRVGLGCLALADLIVLFTA